MFNLVQKAGKALFSPGRDERQQQVEMSTSANGHLPYPPTQEFSRSASKMSFHNYRNQPYYAYAAPSPYPINYKPPKPKPPPRTCSYECQNVLALLCLCVGIIVKGVAFGNSHWANHDQIDFNNNREQFPIMTNFIEMKSGKFQSTCEDMKCKIFFDKYDALQRVAQAQNRPAVPLRGTYSRGVNSRCETAELSTTSGDLVASSVLGSTSGTAKYEKCVVDKQSEVNEYRTIRYLLIFSMVADGLGIVTWVILFVRPARPSAIRLCFVLAALLGFISALLTALAIGLFTQAVDIMEDPHMSLGWPFYITGIAGFLAIVSSLIAAFMLYRFRKQMEALSPGVLMRMGPHHRPSPTVSVVELDSGGPVVYEADYSSSRGQRAIGPPVAPRSRSRENLQDDDVSYRNVEKDRSLDDRRPSFDRQQQQEQQLTPRQQHQFRRGDASTLSSRTLDDDRPFNGYRRDETAQRSNRSAFNHAL